MAQTGAGRLDIRCFLEGVEVPCVSVSVSMNIDAPATCVVQCIPTASSTKILPRTSLHVFYKEPNDTEYRLFFAGEIVGYQYSKTPVSLSIVYQAVDDSSYWDTAYQYFVDYGRGSDWLFQQKSSFMGTGNALFDSVFREHASVLGGLLRQTPKSYPQLKGLVAGVVSILEAVGGVGGRFKGFNDFFTMAEMRRKVLAQVSAAEADTTSAKIYNYKVFWEWIMRQLGSAGSMVSMRDMIKLLFQYIFHHVCPNPIAKYDPPGERETKTITYRADKSAKGKEIVQLLKKAQDRLFGLLPKFAAFTSQCIEKTRAALINPAFSDAEVRQALKASMTLLRREHAGLLTAFKQAVAQVDFILAKAEQTKGAPSQVLGHIKSVRQDVEVLRRTAIPRAEKRIFTMEDREVDGTHPMFWDDVFFLYGPSEREVAGGNPNARLYSKTTFSVVLDYEVKSSVRPALGVPIAAPSVRVKTRIERMVDLLRQAASGMGATLRSVQDVSLRERLHTQIMRPDLWFAAPPKCNVVFPDEYISFQYSRSFLQEVTRLELTTAMEIVGSNSVTNSRYFAPNIQDVTGKYTLQSARSGVRLIMPHEVYVGILPQFQFQSEANIYAARGDQRNALRVEAAVLREQSKYLRSQAQAIRSGGYKDEQEAKQRAALYEQRAARIEGRAKGVETGGISYIQRAVNYMYFKERFASRSMGVQGLFLPRMVLGFPGVVINRPATAFDPDAPNYVGDVAGIQHSVSQEGGSTQIGFQTPREAKGIDDDFLGIDGAMLQSIRAGSTRKTMIYPAQINRRFKFLGSIVSKGSPALNPTALQVQSAERAKDEMRKLASQIDFIREFERRVETKQSYIGMRGPNGGPVSAVKAAGTPKYPTLGKETQVAKRRLEEMRKAVSSKGVVTQDDVLAAEAGYKRAYAQDDNWLPADLKYRDKYEVTEKYATVTRRITMPVEEQLFPTWISPIYRNESIGRDTLGDRRGPYRQFFGCGAITDDPADTPDTRRKMEQDLKEGKVMEGPLRPAKTIEEAVEEIAQTYDRVRGRGLDVIRFIRDYTTRPVATMEDILGSFDLAVDEKGKVITGTLGFHSFAFGDYDNLEGLEGAAQKMRGASNQQQRVARSLDVRKKRRERVQKYRNELDRGQGQRGA